MNKKEEYSYSNSSDTRESFGKPWGEATGKNWGDATKERDTNNTECPFLKCFKPCRQCPIGCPNRVEEFVMEI